MNNNLKLCWSQPSISSSDPMDPAHTTWQVHFPDPEIDSNPVLLMKWVIDKPYSQNHWMVTVLNLFFVYIEATIWDAEKAKEAAELIYFKALETLNSAVNETAVSQ